MSMPCSAGDVPSQVWVTGMQEIRTFSLQTKSAALFGRLLEILSAGDPTQGPGHKPALAMATFLETGSYGAQVGLRLVK